ncbi:MAG: Fis family transcriptional regulator [Endozoicomonadaceae bacterium]|nr:Fis family transcriptional regulator [Endozoicomonadaceae bacterium]
MSQNNRNIHPTDNPIYPGLSLKKQVTESIGHYFSHLEDEDPQGLYRLVMGQVESALIESILQHARGNQTKTAILLGISRGTLAKKMHLYQIDIANIKQ